jgi:hypothetical protein
MICAFRLPASYPPSLLLRMSKSDIVAIMCPSPRDCFSFKTTKIFWYDCVHSNNKKACSPLVFLVGENGEGYLHGFGAGNYQNKVHTWHGDALVVARYMRWAISKICTGARNVSSGIELRLQILLALALLSFSFCTLLENVQKRYLFFKKQPSSTSWIPAAISENIDKRDHSPICCETLSKLRNDFDFSDACYISRYLIYLVHLIFCIQRHREGDAMCSYLWQRGSDTSK